MFQRIAFALVGLVIAGAGHAQDGQWKAGTHYFLIDPPQATADPSKIEVTEVFSYGCPACYQFVPQIKKIKAKLPANAVLNYLPASFNPSEQWPLFQRTFYTSEALGVMEKSHDAMFGAVWNNGPLAVAVDGKMKSPPPTIEDVAKYFEQYGVKPADFVATASSFAINTKMKRADAYIKATQVDSTPTIIVNGKYRLNGKSAGSWENVEALIVYLVQKESAAQ